MAMEFTPRRRLELVSGRSHPELAQDVAKQLGVTLGEANLREFANGEIHCRFDTSIRGSDVFIIQTHCGPVNDSLMEHLIMIDAAKRASAKRITAVCPYYGYSRQDRKATGREPITAKLVADMLSVAGADRVVSVDLHSGQIQGFFDVPFDHLTAAPVLVDYLRAQRGEDLVVVAPDAGRVKVAERFSQHLTADLAVVHKRRLRGETNQVEALHVVGDVEGRQCVLIDDMIDTAGTIVAAADLLADRGASEVWCMATHAVLSDPAVDRLKNFSTHPGCGDRHLADSPGPPFRQARGALGGQAHLRRHRRRLRGHVGIGDLWRGEPRLACRSERPGLLLLLQGKEQQVVAIIGVRWPGSGRRRSFSAPSSIPLPPARTTTEPETLVGAQVVVMTAEPGQIVERYRTAFGKRCSPVVELESLCHVTPRDYARLVPFDQGSLEGGRYRSTQMADGGHVHAAGDHQFGDGVAHE